MGCHPPYPAVTSARDIVSEAELKTLAIFAAMSLRAIKSLARAAPDSWLLEESDASKASATLTAIVSLPVVDSAKDIESETAFKKDATFVALSTSVSISDALTPTVAMKLVISERVIESEDVEE
jgi:hypothetical protein